MIHIATTHLGPRWVDVQLAYLRRHMREPYRTWAALEDVPLELAAGFDTAIPTGGRHPAKLNLLWHAIDAVAAPEDVVIFMDSDAFPVADPMPTIRAALSRTSLVAIRRDENDGDRQPHPSFAAARADAWRAIGCDWGDGYLWQRESGPVATDVGANLLYLLESKGLDWTPLLRTNTSNPHPVFFGVYGGVVYHHGAGSRLALSRRDEIEVPFHRGGMPILRKLRNAFVRLKWRARVRENERLSASYLARLQSDPEFFRPLLERPARSLRLAPTT